MLAGREDSVFARRYVMPLIRSGAVKILRLSPEVEWQKSVLQCLREAFLTYDEGKYGFELMVRARLTECLWHIVRNMRAAMLSYEGAPEASEERAKQMLDFIHLRYAEPIQLADIAAAANVGERECLRAFKKTLGVTPTAYLLRYRASMSAQMLLDTDKSIAEICFEVGFNSQSHYGQIFKRFFHMTPREYRTRYGKGRRSVGGFGPYPYRVRRKIARYFCAFEIAPPYMRWPLRRGLPCSAPSFFWVMRIYTAFLLLVQFNARLR